MGLAILVAVLTTIVAIGATYWVGRHSVRTTKRHAEETEDSLLKNRSLIAQITGLFAASQKVGIRPHMRIGNWPYWSRNPGRVMRCPSHPGSGPRRR